MEASGSVVSFDARLFETLLVVLAKKAIPIIDLDTLLASDSQDGIAITFDDGMKSVYQNALPILREYQVPAHVFLTTGVVGGDGRWPQQSVNLPPFEMLNWKEVETLHQAGVLFESHTHTHPDLRLLTQDQVAEECGQADEIITARLGRKPRYFAYPFGYHNQVVREFIRGLYAASVTTELRQLGAHEDTAALPRLDAYYLRSKSRIRLIDSSAMHVWLSLRNSLRTLRGSQCVADQV